MSEAVAESVRGKRLPLRTGSRLLLLLLLAAAPLAAYATGQTFWMTLIARTAILAIAAASLAFLLRDGGLVSFGHAAPFGIGAYAALLSAEGGITSILAVMPAAFGSAALFSLMTGAAALRTRGVYFIMVTLAFAQMAYFTLSSLTVFGGDDGMTLASRATLFGRPFLAREIVLAVFAVFLLGAALYMLERLSVSGFGRVFRAARENEERVSALGFNPYFYRLGAYTIAGGIAGLSGAMLANQTEYVSPAMMSWHLSGEFIVMAVLGSAAGPWGAILGAAIFVLFEQAVGSLTEHWKLLLGLIVIMMALGRKAWLPLQLKARPRV
ncbi:MAG TPA: branched-chain amino acid ABC transporter permease [Hyphomicrobiales bacterium]|nr:branched-chain amino acid ABC transporter permease [Hyphomicrobiales bacterium]